MSNELDYECEGQMCIEDLFIEDTPESIFAVSKIFARARKQMNLSELKAFTYALANFKFTESNPNRIKLDKKKLASVIGVKCDNKHLTDVLKRSIGNLSAHSFVEFYDKDKEFYENGFIINKVRTYKDNVWFTFDEEYIKLFSGLQRDYITMWSGDIFQMKSERSVIFYEHLRLNSDTRIVNKKGFGIKALKEMFGIPKNGKGSYMRENGGFNRTEFEHRVIDRLCDDLSKCKMIQLVLNEDGKYYKKLKKGNKVLGYEFSWVISDRPEIADATRMFETRTEIEKDPQILKVASDIVKGRKNKKNNPKSNVTKNNSFNNFEQRDTDYSQIESMLDGVPSYNPKSKNNLSHEFNNFEQRDTDYDELEDVLIELSAPSKEKEPNHNDIDLNSLSEDEKQRVLLEMFESIGWE